MGELHQRPRKILISGGKQLFQQHRPIAEFEYASQQLIVSLVHTGRPRAIEPFPSVA